VVGERLPWRLVLASAAIGLFLGAIACGLAPGAPAPSSTASATAPPPPAPVQPETPRSLEPTICPSSSNPVRRPPQALPPSAGNCPP
jgi:hypothetical protein